MANLNFNIVEVTRQAFGLGTLTIPFGGLPAPVEYDQIDVIEVEGVYPKSKLLGANILDTVYFKEGDEVIYHLDGAPVISLNRPKHIVKSRVRRRAGVVRELISNGDYIGTIKGILVNSDSNDPPYDKIAELARVADRAKEWEVESDLFTELDIFNIVITDISFPTSRGMANYQPYVISFESDEPIILKE